MLITLGLTILWWLRASFGPRWLSTYSPQRSLIIFLQAFVDGFIFSWCCRVLIEVPLPCGFNDGTFDLTQRAFFLRWIPSLVISFQGVPTNSNATLNLLAPLYWSFFMYWSSSCAVVVVSLARLLLFSVGCSHAIPPRMLWYFHVLQSPELLCSDRSPFFLIHKLLLILYVDTNHVTSYAVKCHQ